MFKRVIIFTLFMLGCFTTYSQSITQKIPEDAKLVFALNRDHILEKTDLSAIWELSVIKSLEEEMQKSNPDNFDYIRNIYHNPAKLGVNFSPASYVFLREKDGFQIISMIFSLSDESKFMDFLERTLIPNSTLGEITISKTHKFVYKDELGMAWTKNMAMFSSVVGEGNAYEGLNYEDPDYYEKIEKRQAEIQKEKVAVLLEEFADILTSSSGKSIANNENFQKFLKEDADMSMWIDFGYLNKLNPNLP